MADQTTREQIVNVADDLFYRQGYEHTSFSDIAGAVKISRGNFYYHFKSKDDILNAVIDCRTDNTRKMLSDWEAQTTTPAERILKFIEILIMNRAKIKKYGCPVGTLCTELVKLEHPSQPGANRLFTLFRVWLRKQFQELGFKKGSDALAMQLLARSQGVATLAAAYQDEKFIKSEVADMRRWLQAKLKPQNGHIDA